MTTILIKSLYDNQLVTYNISHSYLTYYCIIRSILLLMDITWLQIYIYFETMLTSLLICGYNYCVYNYNVGKYNNIRTNNSVQTLKINIYFITIISLDSLNRKTSMHIRNQGYFNNFVVYHQIKNN